VDKVRFVETELRRSGLREGAFDVVYSSGVLHHTPDPRASFAALARLAKPGGSFFPDRSCGEKSHDIEHEHCPRISCFTA